MFRYRERRGCYGPHACGEAGERIGSLCAIEVEGLKRRQFRIQDLGYKAWG